MFQKEDINKAGLVFYKGINLTKYSKNKIFIIFLFSTKYE